MAVFLAFDLGDLLRVAVTAMAANRAVRPQLGLKGFAGAVLVMEHRVLENGGFGHGVLNDANPNKLATFVKYINATSFLGRVNDGSVQRHAVPALGGPACRQISRVDELLRD